MDEISNQTDILNQLLKNYCGIVGILSGTDIEETEIKLGVIFDIRENIKEGSSLFEIAFLDKNQLYNDGYDTIISARLSILGRKCNDTSKHICLVVNRHGVTNKKIEIASVDFGTHIGVITMTKRFNDIVFHFSDKELICKLLFKISKEYIFNMDIVSLFGVMKKENYARVILSVIGHDKNRAIFDEMMCHKRLYISGDGNAIANYNVGSQFKRCEVFHKVYRGVLGNIAFKENSNDSPLKPVYFEVQFHFDMKENHVSENTLFEFGLTPRNLIDKHKALKYHSNAIIVAISPCKPDLFCVYYWQEGKSHDKYTELDHYDLQKYVTKFKHYLHQFGIKIDPYKREISIYWIDYKKNPFT